MADVMIKKKTVGSEKHVNRIHGLDGWAEYGVTIEAVNEAGVSPPSQTAWASTLIKGTCFVQFFC